ncbi:BolA family protein [Toxoplasma gondii RUB]|uniref:BolA family protein n=1 Tax=Toxoplasma gondii RUB TaxID=935652 RepID=A0A086LSM6_TOXGO|nr:BolA family protein [Toxoplasma gondii RUB]
MGVCCSPRQTPLCPSLPRSLSRSELSGISQVCWPTQSGTAVSPRGKNTRFSCFSALSLVCFVPVFFLSVAVLLSTACLSVRSLCLFSSDAARTFRLRQKPASALSPPLQPLSFALAFPCDSFISSQSSAWSFSPAVRSKGRNSGTERLEIFRGANPPLEWGGVSLFRRVSAASQQPPEMLFRSLSRLASSASQTTLKGPVTLAIEKKLTEGLQPTQLQVVDETPLHAGHEGTQGLRSAETHFRIFVKSAEFKGLPLLQRHRKVYALLQKELDEGIHALAIHAEASD